jgi:ribosomal protein S18 acetylase RimI-like enzyme
LSQTADLPCFTIKASTAHVEPVDQQQGAPSFYAAKVDVKDIARVDDLSMRGFKLVDTALTLRREVQAGDAAAGLVPSLDLVIDEATSDDVDAVAAIALSTFRFSRFHLDSRFPNDAAGRIKREWARNLASGNRGAGCLVARRSGRVVAFLGYLHADDPGPMTVIDLIAVDSTEQGTGVGTSTVSALLVAAGRQGRGVLAGTQAANRASVRLYESLGFRLDSASYVLHGHLPASETE